MSQLADMEKVEVIANHESEVRTGERFEFGKNWQRFLEELNDERILQAEQTLKEMLEVDDLGGQSFVDIGAGSGLFSLAAKRLGARVHSFDYDPHSVVCTREIRRRYFPNDAGWVVEEGSVLDLDYVHELGRFDIVYAWGVLHHTGAMWNALENVALLVRTGGQLYISIYNDQGSRSRHWRKVKQTYNAMPKSLRFLVLWPCFLRLWLRTMIVELIRFGNPFRTWNNYHSVRGMSAWRDVVDWVGGYPFEVAKPDQIFQFYRDKGFSLRKLKTCGAGHGCNEFVFRKDTT